MTIHVGVDADGCIYPFVTGYTRLYGPPGAGHDDWEDYNCFRQWGITDDQFKGHLKSGAKYKGLFSDEAPYPGVIGAWSRLRELPVKVHLITHRVREAWGPTIEWLEAFGLEVDSLHFSSDKTILAAVAGPDASHLMMCEDTVSHFVAVEEAGIDAYLIDQPWNREYSTNKRLPDFAAFVDEVDKTHRIMTGLF